VGVKLRDDGTYRRSMCLGHMARSGIDDGRSASMRDDALCGLFACGHDYGGSMHGRDRRIGKRDMADAIWQPDVRAGALLQVDDEVQSQRRNS
jgi:hypothetical protein